MIFMGSSKWMLFYNITAAFSLFCNFSSFWNWFLDELWISSSCFFFLLSSFFFTCSLKEILSISLKKNSFFYCLLRDNCIIFLCTSGEQLHCRHSVKLLAKINAYNIIWVTAWLSLFSLYILHVTFIAFCPFYGHLECVSWACCIV